MKAAATFVLVGHCGADSYGLSRAVSRAVKDAAVVSADNEQTLARHIEGGGVLLINRVLDGGFATESGVDLIASLAAHEPKPAMILISNYADAQDAAVAAGAQRGFGKSELGSPRVDQLLKSLAAGKAATTESST